jgi:hypothetical protein
VVPAQFAGLSLADFEAGDWQSAALCAMGLALFTTRAGCCIAASWRARRRSVDRPPSTNFSSDNPAMMSISRRGRSWSHSSLQERIKRLDWDEAGAADLHRGESSLT